MSVSSRLKYAINMANVRVGKFSEISQIPYDTLNSWISEKRTLSFNKSVQICVTLKKLGILCSPNWLIGGKGMPPMSIESLSETFPENLGIDCAVYPQTILQLLNFFKSSFENCMIHLVIDESMRPCYEPGDYVGGITVDFELSSLKKLIGKVCIIEKGNGDVFLRKIAGVSESREMTLKTNSISHMPEKQPSQSLKNIAPVIFCIKNIDFL